MKTLVGAVIAIAALASPAGATRLVFSQTGIGTDTTPGFAVSAEIDFAGADLPILSYQGILGVPAPPTIADLYSAGFIGFSLSWSRPGPFGGWGGLFTLRDFTLSAAELDWTTGPGPDIAFGLADLGRGTDDFTIGFQPHLGPGITIDSDRGCGVGDCVAVGGWAAAPGSLPEASSLALLLSGLTAVSLAAARPPRDPRSASAWRTE